MGRVRNLLCCRPSYLDKDNGRTPVVSDQPSAQETIQTLKQKTESDEEGKNEISIQHSPWWLWETPKKIRDWSTCKQNLGPS